ncbi:MAG: hypothetical protein ACRC33_18340 [Gemmataceae bacterium]
MPDRKRRADLIEAVQMFSELARNIRTWRPVLEGWDVGESQILNPWRAEAAARATLRTKRQYILGLLDARFPGKSPAEVRQSIEQQDSNEVLDDWFRSLAEASTIDDFLRALRR